MTAVEPVAWRVLVNENGRIWYVYTERLPYTPDDHIKIRSEPEPLYAAPLDDAELVEATEAEVKRLLAVPQAVAPTGEVWDPVGFAYQDAQWVDRGRWHLCKTEPNAINGRKVERVYREAALTALSAKLAEDGLWRLWNAKAQELAEKADAKRAEATDLRRKLEEARKALESFGREAAAWSDMWEDSFVPIFDTGHLCEHCGHANSEDMKAKFTVGDLRRARALRESLPTAEGEKT